MEKKEGMPLHFCEHGHQLHWTTSSRKPYTSGYYQCDRCEKHSLPCSAGRWNCLQCTYDLCPNCLPLPDSVFHNIDFCQAGHLLNFSTVPNPFHPFSCFICDSCSTNYKYSCGRFCCIECDFDICPSCKISLSCPKGHKLLWSKGAPGIYGNGYYECDKCARTLPCSNYRWFCYECTYDLCINCSLALIPPPKTPSPPIVPPKDVPAPPQIAEKFVCKICFENEVNTLLLPCGHSFCWSCASELTDCPMDRKKIVEKKQIFFS